MADAASPETAVSPRTCACNKRAKAIAVTRMSLGLFIISIRNGISPCFVRQFGVLEISSRCGLAFGISSAWHGRGGRIPIGMFNIVLVEPEIPHNAGAAGRLALATGSSLHLVKPLGFSLEDKYVKRTGLDYWQDVDLHVWENFAELEAAMEGKGMWFLSTKAAKSPWDAAFKPGDCLVFGKETKGLPSEVLQGRAAQTFRLPMRSPHIRSLNLANAATAVAYQAMRPYLV